MSCWPATWSMLTAEMDGRNYVVSLLMNPDASTDYFVRSGCPNGDLRVDVIAMNLPEASNQRVVGLQLFSAHYSAAPNHQIELPKGTLEVCRDCLYAGEVSSRLGRVTLGNFPLRKFLPLRNARKTPVAKSNYCPRARADSKY